MNRFMMLSGLAAAPILVLTPASAQLNGSHSLGDFGVASGSQPAPGFYAALFYYHYGTDVIKDRNGNVVQPFPQTPGSMGVSAIAPIFWYVSKAKVLGANVGAFITIPFANASIEAPGLALAEEVSTKISDLLIRPIDLGWHFGQADVSGGLQVYAPTGEYVPGGSENIGKGMWSWEPFVGATLYADKARTFSIATTAYWELHGTKKDTDVKVGEIMSLQGGVGKSFLGGGLIIGAAYYAQWKLGADQGGTFNLPGQGPITVQLDDSKHSVYGFGPDITLPIATKKKLYSLVNIRYLWETGAKSKTEGESLVITATFPIPSIKLQ